MNTDAHMVTGGGVGLGVVRDASGQLLEVAIKRTNARWWSMGFSGRIEWSLQGGNGMWCNVCVPEYQPEEWSFLPINAYYDDIDRIKGHSIFLVVFMYQKQATHWLIL